MAKGEEHINNEGMVTACDADPSKPNYRGCPFDNNGGHLPANATAEERAEFEAKAEEVAQKAAEQSSTVGGSKSKPKKDDWDQEYNGHASKHDYVVSLEALDNDEQTYRESVAIASSDDATGEDLKALVQRRQQESTQIAQGLEGADLNKVDWDTKLAEIREDHGYEANSSSSATVASRTVVPGGFGEATYDDFSDGERESVQKYRQEKLSHHKREEERGWETLEADYLDDDGLKREDADSDEYYELADTQNHHIAAGIAYDAPPNATVAEVEGGSVYAYYDAEGNKLHRENAFPDEPNRHGHAEFITDTDEDLWGVPDNLRASSSAASAENGDFIDLKKARDWSAETNPSSDSQTIRNNEQLMDKMMARKLPDDEKLETYSEAPKNTFHDRSENAFYSTEQKPLNIFS